MSFYRPHARVIAEVGTESMTKQEFKDECDIYNILKQYQRTGIITHVQAARPTYMDLPSDIDYQSALNIQLQATEAFNGLPGSVRDFYKNDPALLLAAIGDPENHPELYEFGILTKPAPATTPASSAPSPDPSPSPSS